MLLHAQHAASSYESVILHSSDTDVLVLSIAHSVTISARLFMRSVGRSSPTTIDVSAIAKKLGPQLCSALLGFHAVTGCDSTSSFFRIGKKKAWKVLLSKPEHQMVLSQVGAQLPLSPAVAQGCEKFVCHLYGHPIAIR